MNTYVAPLIKLVKQDTDAKKFEESIFRSHKYHATTSRLKNALRYLEEAIQRFKIKDAPAYEALVKLAIITYWACFSKSNLLLKNIPINDALKEQPDLFKTHEKVKNLRDKMIAHQDKTDELIYDVDLEFSSCCHKILGLSFPWLEKPKFGTSDIEKFWQLIIIVHDFLDKERQDHDNKLIERLREVFDDEKCYEFCQKSSLLTMKQYIPQFENRLLNF